MFGAPMPTSQENPDETINALRKLPSNKRCPNCQVRSGGATGDQCGAHNVDPFQRHCFPRKPSSPSSLRAPLAEQRRLAY